MQDICTAIITRFVSIAIATDTHKDRLACIMGWPFLGFGFDIAFQKRLLVSTGNIPVDELRSEI
jgi:hypothetical protein